MKASVCDVLTIAQVEAGEIGQPLAEVLEESVRDVFF